MSGEKTGIAYCRLMLTVKEMKKTPRRGEWDPRESEERRRIGGWRRSKLVMET